MILIILYFSHYKICVLRQSLSTYFWNEAFQMKYICFSFFYFSISDATSLSTFCLSKSPSLPFGWYLRSHSSTPTYMPCFSRRCFCRHTSLCDLHSWLLSSLIRSMNLWGISVAFCVRGNSGCSSYTFTTSRMMSLFPMPTMPYLFLLWSKSLRSGHPRWPAHWCYRLRSLNYRISIFLWKR
jgi:hypothetical protein